MTYTNQEVLDALNGSIDKWVKVTCGREENGVDDCPLCKLFCDSFENRPCVGCPVKEYSGALGCTNTPYGEFNGIESDIYLKKLRDRHIEAAALQAKRAKAANDMRLFLVEVKEHYFGEQE